MARGRKGGKEEGGEATAMVQKEKGGSKTKRYRILDELVRIDLASNPALFLTAESPGPIFPSDIFRIISVASSPCLPVIGYLDIIP